MKKFLLFIFLIIQSANLSAQYIHDSVWVQTEFRYYNLHVPANYTGATNIPLVLAFHGGGNLGWGNLEYYSKFKLKSDSEEFFLVFPEGKKYTSSIFFGWNAGTCCYPNSTNNSEDIEFTGALLDKLIQDYNVDTNRVYAFGSSVGGMFSLRLACEMSQRIAAIGVSNGTQTFFPCNPQRAVPIINVHSMADSVVYFSGGVGNQSVVYGVNLISQDSLMSFWKAVNNCQSVDTIINGHDSAYTYIRIHNCICDDVKFDNYFTTDGGHTWAGGPPTGSTAVSYQISSTDLMWDFFSSHSLHECEDTVTSNLNIIKTKQISVFPNPFVDEFVIQIPEKGVLIIYDLLGRKLFEKQINSLSEKIFFRTEHSGNYIIQLITNSNTIETKIIFNAEL